MIGLMVISVFILAVVVISLLSKELNKLAEDINRKEIEIDQLKSMLLNVTHSEEQKEYTKAMWLPVVQRELATRLGKPIKASEG